MKKVDLVQQKVVYTGKQIFGSYLVYKTQSM